MKTLTALSLCAALAGAGLGAGALAQDRPARAAVPPDMTASLLQGLRETEGCLGVDAARMMSGKNSIFAWFEDKAAVKRWYDHPVHRRMLAASGVEPDGEPMEHIEDGVPILVVATISFAGPPAVAESQIPFSQMSIELYGALPGGAHINGRLAPDAFEVDHMQAYYSDDEGDGEE